MEPTIQDIQDLRNKFLQKIQDDKKDFHQKDLNRVNNDDNWLRRFLIHHDLDMKDALIMLLDTCEWRKVNKVNDISEQTVNKEYLEEGSLFVHGRDKDGKSLFIFKCCKHVKGQKDFEELKKCVIYWMERVERQDKGDQITIFFDMTNSGVANMDMEYTNYLINLCKLYYPHFLNYILIFEMPWILNATFKIIKTWLPTKAVQKIKFVHKTTLKDYVDSQNALKSWGGTDDYEFVFVPESSNNEENKKKVHFADGSPQIESFGSNDDTLPPVKVKLVPDDVISFSMQGLDLNGSFTLQNISYDPVTFKVKTTSPEKFRVRPSCGTLAPNETSIVSISLLTGYTGANIVRDKFLVKVIPFNSNDYSGLDLNEIWRQADNVNVEEHRLRCKVTTLQQSMSHNGAPGVGLPGVGLSISPSSELEQKISQLLLSMTHVTESCFKLENSIKFHKCIILFLLIVVIYLAFCLTYLMHNLENGVYGGYCEAKNPPLPFNNHKTGD